MASNKRRATAAALAREDADGADAPVPDVSGRIEAALHALQNAVAEEVFADHTRTGKEGEREFAHPDESGAASSMEFVVAAAVAAQAKAAHDAEIARLGRENADAERALKRLSAIRDAVRTWNIAVSAPGPLRALLRPAECPGVPVGRTVHLKVDVRVRGLDEWVAIHSPPPDGRFYHARPVYELGQFTQHSLPLSAKGLVRLANVIPAGVSIRPQAAVGDGSGTSPAFDVGDGAREAPYRFGRHEGAMVVSALCNPRKDGPVSVLVPAGMYVFDMRVAGARPAVGADPHQLALWDAIACSGAYAAQALHVKWLKLPFVPAEGKFALGTLTALF